MNPKYILLFLFFSLFFIFYPGNSYYFHIFAYNRNLFNHQQKTVKKEIKPIPYIDNKTSPDITAEGVYIVDLPSFTPVFQKNSHIKFYPASTTKIITALVAYDLYKPDQIIKIDQVKAEGQIMNLVPGEKITIENLLYGILVHSGNDAAYAIANHYGYNQFIKNMNDKAKQLKMKNTHFDNPSGLDSNDQVSTPYDLALAARELLNNPYLAKIVSTKEIIISDIDYKYFHRLTNVNKLLGEIQGIGGLKTGYTENAGENLISFYKNNGHQFLIILLKSQDRFKDTTNIVEWINSNVKYYQ